MSRVASMLGPVGLGWISNTRTYKAFRDPEWTFSQAGRDSRQRLRDLRNSQEGEHGYIVGTGPSLHKVDFTRLRGKPSIGLNRLFLGFEDFDFVPDFLVCVNLLMLEQSGKALSNLPCQLVAAWKGRRFLAPEAEPVLMRTHSDVKFSTALMDRVYTGGTVTHVALQFAHWLGWSRVTLIGIDHNYALTREETEIGPHGMVERDGPDTNHFAENYMGQGAMWQVPDLHQSEAAYKLARTVFERTGRRVEDGTVDGKLRVFERTPTDYSRAFDVQTGSW